MDVTDLNEIRRSLETKDAKELLNYCIRLARFKKENKELFSFLLFDAHDLERYVAKAKSDIENSFLEINQQSIYYIKKSVRKILRNVNKYTRFSLSKEVEAELLIHFCNCIVLNSIPIKQCVQLKNLYDAQLKKIEKALSALHPDLQFDLKKLILK